MFIIYCNLIKKKKKGIAIVLSELAVIVNHLLSKHGLNIKVNHSTLQTNKTI